MKRRPATPYQAGIIDIGSHSVRLEIFEIRSGGRYTLLESATRSLNLGQDVFRRGRISPENLNLLCQVMSDFARLLDGYGVAFRRAVGTSALREAANRELVVDRVRFESGIAIDTLEPQEESKLYFLALREELFPQLPEEERTGIGFIVGTGSLLVNYFERGVLKFSEAAPIGSVRTVDEFGHDALTTELMIENLSTLDLKRRLSECARLDPERPLLLVGLGAGIRLLTERYGGTRGGGLVALSGAEAQRVAEQALKAEPENLQRELSTADYLAISIPACGALLNYFLREFPCARFFSPAISTRSALVAELIRDGRGGDRDPYEQDIIASAEGVARKYGLELEDARATARCALKLFDKLRRSFELGGRSRLYLQLAALLHDIGHFVDTRQHHKHSWYLIVNTQFPGIREAEKRIIAAVARYHRKATPQRSHEEYAALPEAAKVTVLKLAAILRVADALTHLEQAGSFKLILHGKVLTIRAADLEGVSFSSVYLKSKSDLFYEVFGLEIRLEEAPVQL